jgi:actin related protein 2/3 complex subunit 3
LNAVYAKPTNRKDEEDMRAYIKQLRLETGVRVLNRVYENSDKPSKVRLVSLRNLILVLRQIQPFEYSVLKWWLCFAKRRFMDQTLTPLGQLI